MLVGHVLIVDDCWPCVSCDLSKSLQWRCVKIGFPALSMPVLLCVLSGFHLSPFLWVSIPPLLIYAVVEMRWNAQKLCSPLCFDFDGSGMLKFFKIESNAGFDELDESWTDPPRFVNLIPKRSTMIHDWARSHLFFAGAPAGAGRRWGKSWRIDGCSHVIDAWIELRCQGWFHGIIMGFYWDSTGILMGFYWDSNGILMGL